MTSAQQSAMKASALAAAREVEELRLTGLDPKVPRPYLSKQARQDIKKGLRLADNEITQSELRQLLEGPVAHLGFCEEEVQYIKAATKQWYARYVATKSPNNGLQQKKPDLVDFIRQPSDKCKGAQLVRQRSVDNLRQYLKEAGKIRSFWSAEVQVEEVLRIEPRSIAQEHRATTSVRSVLFSREMSRGSSGRGYRPPKSQVLTLMDDDIRRMGEITGFSGDIATITLLPGDRFICGAITHSDESNQQYNKPGNLVFGSTERKTAKSVSGHRIRRPIVEKGSNSLASMRETQDPWLYCSVTSTAYDDRTKLCFTGSFDRTVKVWNVAADGSTMDLYGTWSHAGVVNFVVTSPYHGKVATAADVVEGAIRVYEIDQIDISNSAFDTYSGSRADEQCLERQNWAYYPATIQWGKARSVAHLLLAGYSPRTFDVHQDVPEDRENTGELCLWDTATMTRVPISSARTQNVFEVAWHPTRPIFLAATSATGDHEENVRTQLRLFSRTETGTFAHSKTFDCQALDINEISLMRNSATSCYVTASCTNGNTYVWDSAQDEDAIHILRHGPSIDDSTPDTSPEEVDSGVKFAAWGRTADRFYTGSSDGVVKAWNIRAPPGEVHVADVLTLSGGISAGVFSDDHSRLVIGDATGKIHVLRTGDLEDAEEERPKFRHSQPVTPHYEPSRPVVDEEFMELDAELTARELAQRYVDGGQIVVHPDRYVGAIQGPNYSSTGLMCKSLRNDDSSSSSLNEMLYQQRKRYEVKAVVIRTLGGVTAASGRMHKENWTKDLHPSDLTAETARELEADRMLDFGFQDENEFDYEPDVGRLAEVGERPVRLSGADDQQHYLSEFPFFCFHSIALPCWLCFSPLAYSPTLLLRRDFAMLLLYQQFSVHK
jgi:WD40 repeat protein